MTRAVVLACLLLALGLGIQGAGVTVPVRAKSLPEVGEVIGFLPDWQVEQAVAGLDRDLLTMVSLHGVEASGAGQLVTQTTSGKVPRGWRVLQGDRFGRLASDLQADGIKVLLTVHRNGWNEGQMKRTIALLTDHRRRLELARRIAHVVHERGLDGANLDFEPIPATLSDEYVQLVREIRRALDDVDASLHLSVDVVAGPGYDLQALSASGAADLAILMGYDYRGSDAAVAGAIAPLANPRTDDISSSVERALGQVEPGKLVLALPWYGRGWSTEGRGSHSRTLKGLSVADSTTLSYAQAVELATDFGRRYQPSSASAWTAYRQKKCSTCPVVRRQVWYDDPDGFGDKIDFAVGKGLAGIGIWALGHDLGRPEMWLSLRHKVHPRTDFLAPSGSVHIRRASITGERMGLKVVKGSAAMRLSASDGKHGSGLAFVRIGLSGQQEANGRLARARTYPVSERIVFPLGESGTGGSAHAGRRAIHVQWRDIEGNWSTPLVINVWVQHPTRQPVRTMLKP